MGVVVGGAGGAVFGSIAGGSGGAGGFGGTTPVVPPLLDAPPLVELPLPEAPEAAGCVQSGAACSVQLD
jgi:hypothetical protein